MKPREGVLPIDAGLRALARQDERRGLLSPEILPLVPERADVEPELVAAWAPLHPRAEELRQLRAQLLLRWRDAAPGRARLAVVSSGAAEGRSYVAANLAVLFAQLGRRTLLVDADLRAPRLHRLFRLPQRDGLAALLAGRAGAETLLALPEFGPLALLPAGEPPPHAQDLLLRPALGAALDALEREFDVVLYDTPPAGAHADALALARHAGQALLIARRDRTRPAEVAALERALAAAGARVIGSVYNGAPAR